MKRRSPGVKNKNKYVNHIATVTTSVKSISPRNTSYTEITQDSRIQVDALIWLMKEHGIVGSDAGEYQDQWLREHLANLVQSCLYIEKGKNAGAQISEEEEGR